MLIQLNGIHKHFGKGDSLVRALNGLSLEVQGGEMIAVMGKSGSGKSTLLNIIGALDTIDDGDYFFNDEKLSFENANQMALFATTGSASSCRTLP